MSNALISTGFVQRNLLKLTIEYSKFNDTVFRVYLCNLSLRVTNCKYVCSTQIIRIINAKKELDYAESLNASIDGACPHVLHNNNSYLFRKENHLVTSYTILRPHPSKYKIVSMDQ